VKNKGEPSLVRANRRSFDFTSRDEAARAFAQDDRFLEAITDPEHLRIPTLTKHEHPQTRTLTNHEYVDTPPKAMTKAKAKATAISTAIASPRARAAATANSLLGWGRVRR
jgi:hypothetical protein